MKISGNQFSRSMQVATLTSLVASFPALSTPDLYARWSRPVVEKRLPETLAGAPIVAWHELSANSELSSAMTTQAVSAEIGASLRAQREYLLALPANWDGYGAAPISEEMLEKLECAVSDAIAQVDCRAPDIIPGGDGSIQAEWHMNGLDLSFSVGPGKSQYFAVTAAEADLEFFDEDALPAFRKWAPRLARKAAPLALVA